MSLYPEDIAKRLIAHFEANWATYLAQVEANRADDPITLDDFQERLYADEGVFNASRQYPVLEVFDVDTRLFIESQQQGAIYYLTAVEIRTRCRHQDPIALAKIVDRHLEAFMLMAEADPTLGQGVPDGQLRSLQTAVIRAEIVPDENFRGRRFRFGVKHRM